MIINEFNYRKILNFTEKMLTTRIPKEIERKFLSSYEQFLAYRDIYGVDSCNSITQTYLSGCTADRECRVRKIYNIGTEKISYTYTEKTGSGLVRYEFEKNISEDEYNEILKTSTENFEVVKERTVINGIEFDTYPYRNLVTFEIEFTSLEKALSYKVPDTELSKAIEVTGIEMFSNLELAKSKLYYKDMEVIVKTLKELSSTQVHILFENNGESYGDYSEYIYNIYAGNVSTTTIWRDALNSQTEPRDLDEQFRIETKDLLGESNE